MRIIPIPRRPGIHLQRHTQRHGRFSRPFHHPLDHHDGGFRLRRRRFKHQFVVDLHQHPG